MKQKMDLGEHVFSLRDQPQILLNESYLARTKAHLAAIEEQYNEVLPLCTEINGLLEEFRRILKVEQKTLLSVCFKHLRRNIGRYDTLELNKENMRIDIDEEAEKYAKEAVEKFNLLLVKCSEFPDKLKQAKSVIQERVTALDRERVQTHATMEALARAKEQFEDIEKWANEAVYCIRATKSLSCYLEPNSTTDINNI